MKPNQKTCIVFTTSTTHGHALVLVIISRRGIVGIYGRLKGWFMMRIKVGIMVDEDTWEEFKRFVMDKYGQKRAVLGYEVEQALISYMNP